MPKQKPTGFLAPLDDLKAIAAGPRMGPARCGTRRIVGRNADGEPTHESEHFMTCPECGRAFDMRELGQVLHHDTPGHKPTALDA